MPEPFGLALSRVRRLETAVALVGLGRGDRRGVLREPFELSVEVTGPVVLAASGGEEPPGAGIVLPERGTAVAGLHLDHVAVGDGHDPLPRRSVIARDQVCLVEDGVAKIRKRAGEEIRRVGVHVLHDRAECRPHLVRVHLLCKVIEQTTERGAHQSLVVRFRHRSLQLAAVWPRR